MTELVNWELLENSVELGYFGVYLLLALISINSYRRNKRYLPLFFSLAFISLSISGLYGGLDYFVVGTFIEYEKIKEIYEGLQLLAVILFSTGILKS
ncbi:MAG: hypothetical protein ACW98F_20070 [Candidatus Hodarchaeales archaeon]|jgi:hypothetical protein